MIKMPKFNLKSPGRSRKLGNEKKPLVTSPSASHRSYSGESRSQRNVSTSSSQSQGDRFFPMKSRSPSINSDLEFDPAIKVSPGTPHGPPTPIVPAVLDINFDQVPFLFYTRVGDQWKTAFVQGILLMVLCLLCPCIFIFLIYLCVKLMELRQKGKAEQLKKKQNYFFAGAFIMTFIKDMMIIALVLQGFFKTDASTYVVVFSPVMYCWFLFMFVLPIAIFYFADVQYKFGFDSDRKTLMKSFSTLFFSAKTKNQQAQKMEAQDNYFTKNYNLLSCIQTSMNEFVFVLKSTKKSLIIVSVVLSVLVALIHALVPCFVQLKDYTFLVNHTFAHNSSGFSLNGTVNFTDSHLEHVEHDAHMLYVVGISTFNALTVSLIAAPYFVYVILWKMALLREWKRFNKNERDTQQTLVNGGPQGIAMWWKIRQTLKMFSNGASLSAMIAKMTCLVAMILISVISSLIILLVFTEKLDNPNTKYDIFPMLLDAILLYGALLVIGTLTIMADTEKKLSVDIIELKQLNISYELGHLMNLEQEAIEVEPGVKVKVRVIRGCLMLLQELTSTMENLEKGTSSKLTILCFSISTIMILPCFPLAFKHLSASFSPPSGDFFV